MKRRKHHFRHRAIFLSVKLLNLLILFLPLRLVLYLGKLLGGWVYLLLKKQRQQTIANLKGAFKNEKSDDQINIIAKRVFENLGKNLVELLSFPRINRANIDRLVTADGLERIDRILKQGRGVVVVTAHLGNWELMAAYFGLKGYPAYVVARRLRLAEYEPVLFCLRQAKGVTTIDRGEGPRTILEALKKKGLVGILPDQDVDSVRGVFVEFLGKPAYTPTGPVSLARAAKVPIIPCFIVRKNGGHHLFVERPIEVTRTDNRDEDLRVDTQRWSNVVESYIRKYPEQWVWLHQRWKTKPQ